MVLLPKSCALIPFVVVTLSIYTTSCLEMFPYMLIILSRSLYNLCVSDFVIIGAHLCELTYTICLDQSSLNFVGFLLINV
jgi:hypothetical protein